MKPEMIRLKNVTKTFYSPGTFTALQNVSLSIPKGEFTAIVGKSGSGKTTLMNMFTGIDSPTSGTIEVDGKEIQGLSQNALSVWRGKNIGVIFQFFQLLPTLTVAENIMLPMDFCSTYPVRERRKRALGLLDRVGILDQADKLPSSLSGGQQQRAAIARALANDPSVIAADEPTGNLDSQTADLVLDIFADLRSSGKTILLVTHEREIDHKIDRKIRLLDGRIEGEESYA